jgi:hypothetical protein
VRTGGLASGTICPPHPDLDLLESRLRRR